MDKELSNRQAEHSSQGAIKHLESMSLVPGLAERWRVMNLTFVRDLLLSSVAHKHSLGVSSLQPHSCNWVLSPLGSEIIESICMQSAFKHQVRWMKISKASLWRLFHVLKFTSASRSGRHYGGGQTDSALGTAFAADYIYWEGKRGSYNSCKCLKTAFMDLWVRNGNMCYYTVYPRLLYLSETNTYLTQNLS